MTDASHRLQADRAPTPFSADQIRLGCPAGRTIRLRVEPVEGEPFIRVNRFLETDADGAVQEHQRFALDGTPLDEATTQRVTWRGFQSHASFPAAATVIDEADVEIPAGRFACRRYTVSGDGGVTQFWFAAELPGMPVQVEERGSDGELRFRMVMLENLPGAFSRSSSV